MGDYRDEIKQKLEKVINYVKTEINPTIEGYYKDNFVDSINSIEEKCLKNILSKNYKEAIDSKDYDNIELIKYTCKYLEHCELLFDDFRKMKGFSDKKSSDLYFGYKKRINIEDVINDIENNGLDGPYKMSFISQSKDHHSFGMIRGTFDFSLEEAKVLDIDIKEVNVLNGGMVGNCLREISCLDKYKVNLDRKSEMANIIYAIHEKYTKEEDVPFKFVPPTKEKFPDKITMFRPDRIDSNYYTTKFDFDINNGEVIKSVFTYDNLNDAKVIDTFVDKDVILSEILDRRLYDSWSIDGRAIQNTGSPLTKQDIKLFEANKEDFESINKTEALFLLKEDVLNAFLFPDRIKEDTSFIKSVSNVLMDENILNRDNQQDFCNCFKFSSNFEDLKNYVQKTFNEREIESSKMKLEEDLKTLISEGRKKENIETNGIAFYRYMTKYELEDLLDGKVLKNDKNFGRLGAKTNSVGFCFLPEVNHLDVYLEDFDKTKSLIETPEEAFYRLDGIVGRNKFTSNLETVYLVKFDVEDSSVLNKTWGKYSPNFGMTITAEEYCTTSYDKNNFIPVGVCEIERNDDYKFDWVDIRNVEKEKGRYLSEKVFNAINNKHLKEDSLDT